MPLQTNDDKKLQYAEKYAPEDTNRFVLFATSKDKMQENPKLPNFRGYFTDTFGNVYEIAGWRKVSQSGVITLSGSAEKLDLVREGGEEYPNTASSSGNQDGSDKDDDIPF